MDDLEAPAMKKKKVVCETCSLVGHVTRKSQKCKYSTNEKSKFYGNLPPAVETVESTINNEHNEQHGVSSSKLERRTGLSDMRLSK
jgi:hypothetical protein